MTTYRLTYTNVFDVETERVYVTDAENASEAIAELYQEQTVANLIRVENEVTGLIDDAA